MSAKRRSIRRYRALSVAVVNVVAVEIVGASAAIRKVINAIGTVPSVKAATKLVVAGEANIGAIGLIHTLIVNGDLSSATLSPLIVVVALDAVAFQKHRTIK